MTKTANLFSIKSKEKLLVDHLYGVVTARDISLHTDNQVIVYICFNK